jgi:hypothetical protein
MTKTTGRLHTAARFIDSCTTPWLLAPSPMNTVAIDVVPLRFAAKPKPSATAVSWAMIALFSKFTRGSLSRKSPARPPHRPVALP